MKPVISCFVAVAVFACVIASEEESSGSNDHMEYPCEDSNDFEGCVRSYMHEHADCEVVKQPDHESVYLKDMHKTFVPDINLTMVLQDTVISHLDGKMEAFKIDPTKKVLVMSAKFEGIHLDSKKAHFVVSRRSEEPAVAVARARGVYPCILTAVIPIEEKISLKSLLSSMITAYLPDSHVKFHIGDNVTKSKDPAIAAMVKALDAKVPTVIQELFLTGAPLFFIEFMQTYICDFGITESQFPF